MIEPVKTSAAFSALQDASARLDGVAAEADAHNTSLAALLAVSLRQLAEHRELLAGMDRDLPVTRARLDKIMADADLARARLISAVADDRQAMIDEAVGEASKVVDAAHAAAKEIGDREAAASQERQAEIARLDGEIRDRQSRHDAIVQALAEVRARIGVG